MNIYSQSEITIFFKKINKLKIFVVGDAMLDLYWYGNIERISPEAPVPIVHITHKETRLGGAANVALNCVAMGAEVYLLSTIGKDEQGKQMKSLLEEKNILTNFLLQSVDRITTTKTRVIAKNQQTIRIDDEIVSHLNVKDEHHFIDTCLRAIQIEKPDIVIFEDYNKGLLSENMIEKIITHCKHVGVMTSVDPKLENFFAYKHVDIFKPNLKEVRDAFNIKLEKIDIKNLKKIHTLLFQKLQHHNTIITLSEKGIFVHNDKNASLIPTHIRTIADVSGAGDTVISVASILFFLTKNLTFAAQIANIAGGLVCEQVGVVAINKTKLFERNFTSKSNKLKKFRQTHVFKLPLHFIFLNKQMDTQITGTIKFFNEEKGFGFIKHDDSNKETFVHANGLLDQVEANDKVVFDVQEGRKGLNAVNVKLIN